MRVSSNIHQLSRWESSSPIQIPHFGGTSSLSICGRTPGELLENCRRKRANRRQETSWPKSKWGSPSPGWISYGIIVSYAMKNLGIQLEDVLVSGERKWMDMNSWYKIYKCLKKKFTSWDFGKSSTYMGGLAESGCRSLDRSTAGRDRRKRDDSRAHPMPGGGWHAKRSWMKEIYRKSQHLDGTFCLGLSAPRKPWCQGSYPMPYGMPGYAACSSSLRTAD